jgi:hypothetical protein
MAVAQRLWARVLTAAREQPHEGRNAVAVVVLLRGISLMFRVLQRAGAASDGECACAVVCRVCRACVRACVQCLMHEWPRVLFAPQVPTWSEALLTKEALTPSVTTSPRAYSTTPTPRWWLVLFYPSFSVSLSLTLALTARVLLVMSRRVLLVAAAVKFLATSAPFFHLLPLGPAPEDISRSRTYQQLRLVFHGAADSLVRCAVLQTLVRLRCPGLVQVRNAMLVTAVGHSHNITRPHTGRTWWRGAPKRPTPRC